MLSATDGYAQVARWMLGTGLTTFAAIGYVAYRSRQNYSGAKRRYFLSGVMGGNMQGNSSLVGIPVESQDYRALMRAAILAADPHAEVVDPADMVTARAPELHPHGTEPKQYWQSDATVGTIFGECIELAAECDVVVSYLPMASMGSAVELHAAWRAERLVLVIAPPDEGGGPGAAPGKMRHNWVVRAYAQRVFGGIDEMGAWLAARFKD